MLCNGKIHILRLTGLCPIREISVMILRVMYKLAEYVARVVLKPYAYKRLALIPDNMSRIEGMRQRMEGTKIDSIKDRQRECMNTGLCLASRVCFNVVLSYRTVGHFQVL